MSLKDTEIHALIALGANLPIGSTTLLETIRAAVAWLLDAGLIVTEVSALYSTPAFPVGNGPDFVNGAMAVRWAGDANSLLALCHRVESAFERQRITRWSARTLDVDLIAVGDMICPGRDAWQSWAELSGDAQTRQVPSELILPHPRLHERGFVLVPLADVAPDWQHPILGKSVREMLEALPNSEIEQIKRISGGNSDH